jgi:hypothetical protein
MMFYRNIQARWTPYRKDGTKVAVALEAPGTAVDNSSVGLGNVSAHNSLPDFTAQWRRDADWGHAQVAGILRTLGYETSGAVNGDPSGKKTGYGINLSGSYKVLGKDMLHAQFAYGKGIAFYSNDCCVDLASDAAGNPEAVSLFNWLVYYDHTWNDKFTSSIGYSQNVQDNTAGQAGTAQPPGPASVNLCTPGEERPDRRRAAAGERENKNNSASHTRVQFSARA